MKKKIQKKKYIFILAIAIIYLLGISVHVQAAGNRISVKVNESEKAVLEKTKIHGSLQLAMKKRINRYCLQRYSICGFQRKKNY